MTMEKRFWCWHKAAQTKSAWACGKV